MNMVASRAIVNGIRNGYDGVRTESEGTMRDDDWAKRVKGILRAEMARKSVTYDRLVELLAEIGVTDTAVNLRNKMARGGFSAVFFVQCLVAMGCETVRLD
jgi:hypothetical protein